MKDYTVRTSCRLCEGPLSEPIFDVGESCLANEYVSDPNAPQDTFPLYIVECLTCHHIQLPVVVNPDRLYRRGYKYQSGTSPVYRAHLEAYADQITERCGTGQKILEVGSNDGTFLRMLQERGHTVVGVDPAGTGDDVLLEFMTNATIDRVLEALEGPADVVVANHVFAHVADLPALADAIRGVLREGGTFVLEVADGQRMFTHGLFDLVYSEHHDYHTPDALTRFLAKRRLPVHQVEPAYAQGGSLRAWCGVDGEPRRDAYYRNPEWLRKSVDSVRRYLDSQKPGHAFGACAKLTTFCVATGWTPERVYDDNPQKVGLYTPGTHAPIVAAREILTDNPPSVLVTAWNFYDEIRDRLRAWGYRGDIIRALPSWHVDRVEVAA